MYHSAGQKGFYSEGLAVICWAKAAAIVKAITFWMIWMATKSTYTSLLKVGSGVPSLRAAARWCSL